MFSWLMTTRTARPEGKEIMVPVTIIEIPTMKVAAIRAYSEDTYGKHAFTEIWAEPMDNQLYRRVTEPKNYDSAAAKKKFADALAANQVAEIYAVAYTQPATITGVPKKVPDLMEIKIAGGDCAKQYRICPWGARKRDSAHQCARVRCVRRYHGNHHW